MVVNKAVLVLRIFYKKNSSRSIFFIIPVVPYFKPCFMHLLAIEVPVIGYRPTGTFFSFGSFVFLVWEFCILGEIGIFDFW